MRKYWQWLIGLAENKKYYSFFAPAVFLLLFLFFSKIDVICIFITWCNNGINIQKFNIIKMDFKKNKNKKKKSRKRNFYGLYSSATDPNRGHHFRPIYMSTKLSNWSFFHSLLLPPRRFIKIHFAFIAAMFRFFSRVKRKKN